MQKTAIDWVISQDGSQGMSWNPASGCLGPGGTLDHPRRCPGCYAASIAARWGKTDIARAFLPEFHPDRLEQPVRRKKPTTIFVCSMADLWAPWIPSGWIRQVLDIVLRTERHTYIFLTKNPERYLEFNPYPNNVWLGATTRNQAEYDRAARTIAGADVLVRFISAEPMLGPIDLQPPRWIPDWVIIGDLTRNGKPLGKTKDAWATALTAQAGQHTIPVFHKDSLTERGYTSHQLPGGHDAREQQPLF
jgi:protein gp37